MSFYTWLHPYITDHKIEKKKKNIKQIAKIFRKPIFSSIENIVRIPPFLQQSNLDFANF